MEITWLGHACFRLRGRAATIVTDPYGREVGLNPGKLTADLVTVSHEHPGHANAASIGGGPKVLLGPGGYDFHGTAVEGVQTAHDAKKGAERGRNTVFVITVDDVHVCHLGDLGHVLTAEQVDAIGPVDILLAPVGPNASLKGAELAEVIRLLEPRVIIPMHHTDDSAVDAFCREAGEAKMPMAPRLVVTKESLPEARQVVPLELRATALKPERRAA